MHLKKLILTNFRKYPTLEVEFKAGINVLIGENDQGKTSIIDAVRYLLNTKSNESFRYDVKDFHQKLNGDKENIFEILGIFSGFIDEEAANFLEWGYFNSDKKFELRVLLRVSLKNNNRITWDLKAGPENAETQMDGNARGLLQVTYLKPLRDAEAELTPGYKSRLAQILQSHEAFKVNKRIDEPEHRLVEIVRKANKELVEALDEVRAYSKPESLNILGQINNYLTNFQYEGDDRKASINIVDPELHRILRSLGLEIENNSSGLGTLNKLFMAVELLHLETDPYNSLRLCLIEELEAHLHPQAQLRVINTLREVKNTQFIISTHSTTLGSSINLDDIILCHSGDVYPMWKEKTQLSGGDRQFLQRFLDATKANLFFARGVIMVEGDAENILVPTIAEIIGLPLHRYGVSVVNVGSTAFSRYAKIFNRKDEKILNIPVAVITDLDVKAIEYYDEIQYKSKSRSYFKVADSKIKVGQEIVDISNIHNKIYGSKDALHAAVKAEIQLLRMPKGVNDVIDGWDKIELDRVNIEDVRSARKTTLESNFKYPVKAFVNDYWTLEYDLALSDELRPSMEKAIHIARKIKSSESNFDELYDTSGNFSTSNYDQESPVVNESLSSGEQDSQKKAYEIFKPFISTGGPSKAVTAQILSEILKNCSQSKGKIEKDPNIAYVVNAIKYACGKENLTGVDDEGI